jgi:hypothetical protein
MQTVESMDLVYTEAAGYCTIDEAERRGLAVRHALLGLDASTLASVDEMKRGRALLCVRWVVQVVVLATKTQRALPTLLERRGLAVRSVTTLEVHKKFVSANTRGVVVPKLACLVLFKACSSVPYAHISCTCQQLVLLATQRACRYCAHYQLLATVH